MPDLYLIFSHQLTEYQKNEVHKNFKINNMIPMPYNLKSIWSNIPADIASLKNYLNPIREWLIKNVKPGDYILISGDFGATYLMVDLAFQLRCHPIYATSERQVIKEVKNNKEIIFNRKFVHIKFREYERW